MHGALHNTSNESMEVLEAGEQKERQVRSRIVVADEVLVVSNQNRCDNNAKKSMLSFQPNNMKFSSNFGNT